MGNGRSVQQGSLGQRPSEIVPGLFVGSRLDGMAAKMANPHRFTHVLCLETSSRYPDPESRLEFLLEPLDDGGTSDLPRFVDQIEDFVLDGAKKGKLLVHCASGVNRAPTVAVWYLMRHRGLSLESALKLVRLQRRGVNIHTRYLTQLREMEAGLARNSSKGRLRGDSALPGLRISESSSVGPASGASTPLTSPRAIDSEDADSS